MQSYIQLEKPGELWNAATRFAGKKAGEGRRDKSKFFQKKREEKKRLHYANEFVQERLQTTIKQVPSIQYMHPFHKTLLECSTNIVELKQSIASVQSTKELISQWSEKAIGQVERLRSAGNPDLGIPRKKAWGKIQHAMLKLEKVRAAYNDGIRVLNALPQLDFALKTIVIAGFPNVGKSTLLKRWTSSAPKIAPYPFTTKGIMVGKLVIRHQPIQVLDTPGLLDRLPNQRNPIEQKAIAALEYVADGVLFVIDPTLESGFDLESQKRLLESTKRNIQKPLLLIINKCDTASEEAMEAAKRLFSAETVIQTGNGEQWEENGKEQVMGWIQELKKRE